MLSFIRRLPPLATLVALSAFVITSSLGVWQWQRAGDKTARLAQIEQRAEASPLELFAAMQMGKQAVDFPLRVEGRFSADITLLVDNKLRDGMPGYEVVGLLDTDAGWLPVNWGWLKAGTARDALPDFHLPDGLITLNGRVGEPSLNSFIRETASGAQRGLVRVQQFDPAWIEQHYQLQVLPLMLYVTEPGELRRDWQPVVMPPEKHLAYAIQWFGIALAILIIFFFAVRRTLSNESE